MQNARDQILSRKRTHYDQQIQLHGCTPIGVGWKSAESQEMRFHQLLKVVDRSASFSINDFGCGYGALVEYLRTDVSSFQYCGFDVSTQMIVKAKALHR